MRYKFQYGGQNQANDILKQYIQASGMTQQEAQEFIKEFQNSSPEEQNQFLQQVSQKLQGQGNQDEQEQVHNPQEERQEQMQYGGEKQIVSLDNISPKYIQIDNNSQINYNDPKIRKEYERIFREVAPNVLIGKNNGSLFGTYNKEDIDYYTKPSNKISPVVAAAYRDFYNQHSNKMQYGGIDSISLLGYSDNSPYRNNSSNLIQSNYIDMNNTGIPLLGISNTGDKKVMHPYSGKYKFKGNNVTEIPIAQMGRINLKKKADKYRYYDDNGNEYVYNPRNNNFVTGWNHRTISLNDVNLSDFNLDGDEKKLKISIPKNNGETVPEYIDNRKVQLKTNGKTSTPLYKTDSPIQLDEVVVKEKKRKYDYSLPSDFKPLEHKQISPLNSNLPIRDVSTLPMETISQEYMDSITDNSNQENNQTQEEKKYIKNNNENPLRWYDVASPMMSYINSLSREQEIYNPTNFSQVNLKHINPYNQLYANQSDFNTAISTLLSDGIGNANKANLASKKYAINNQILSQTQNQNNQIDNQEAQYNNEIKSKQELSNQQSRNIFNEQVSIAKAKQDEQKQTSLDKLFNVFQQHDAFNRNLEATMKLAPYFDSHGNYNGKSVKFNLDLYNADMSSGDPERIKKAEQLKKLHAERLIAQSKARKEQGNGY
jgi:hypothetical protein